MGFAKVTPVSSRLVRDDWDDLSARSGGSGPGAGSRGHVLLLLFSSVELGRPSAPTRTESDDVFSAAETSGRRISDVTSSQVYKLPKWNTSLIRELDVCE